jgi:hypothetical protein
VDAKYLRASLTVRTRHVGGRGRPKDDSTEGEKTIISLYYTMWNRFRLQKYRNGGQLWVVNVLIYTIHAQTDCWQSCSPLTLSIFFPLLLWRFPSSKLFCVHSIMSDYRLNDRAIGVRSPAGAKDFSSILCIPTGSEAHPASCPMGIGGIFPGSKAQPGRDADHSPPRSAQVVSE